MSNLDAAGQKKTEGYEAVPVYDVWREKQGVPILRVESAVPNLYDVEVGPWPRFGPDVKGGHIIIDGVEDMNDACVIDIAPNGTMKAEKHMYEEFIYVLNGKGTLTIWNHQDMKQSVEWRKGSLFAIPLNTFHELKNTGSETSRFYVVSTAPVLMNMYHDDEFIFNCEYDFLGRFDGKDDFFTRGEALPGRLWDTNFIKDLTAFEILEWKSRGGGARNRMIEIANSAFTAHLSEMPVGVYKKCHRHGAGANVIIVWGQGYSMLHYDGEERKKIDWKEGSVLCPGDKEWHQHFNTGDKPAAYLALRWGSRKWPVFRFVGERAGIWRGKNQIEYEEEDAAIREIFKEELKKNGVEFKM